jgi:Flp pilus assembly protein TadB
VQGINQNGGATFLVMAGLGIFAFIVFMKELDQLLTVFLKGVIITSLLLAWYWISGRSDIRSATNTMFVDSLKTVLGYQCWPVRLQSWAEAFNV